MHLIMFVSNVVKAVERPIINYQFSIVQRLDCKEWIVIIKGVKHAINILLNICIIYMYSSLT